jgi:nucleotide-binding universal stress UspA family protein
MNTKHEGAVVVGVSESIFHGWALQWAAEQARLEGRRLVLVNASGPVSVASREYDGDIVVSTAEELRNHGLQLLDRARAVVEQTAPGLMIDEVFEVSNAGSLLVQLSTTAHLLVLGSRGRGAIRSHLLGSVGIDVVRHASCPVVVHRPGDHPGRVHRGVVVAAHGTEESAPVLTFAFREASRRGLPLKIVHYVFGGRSAMAGAPRVNTIDEDVDQHSRALASSLAGYRESFPDVHVTVDTLPGLLPERGLSELSHAADLLVVGTHQRGVLGRMLAGSVSEAVLEHSTGPVAVVPTSWPGDS